MKTDKVTIVTVSYNAENDIEKTMRSVCEQSYKNIEYLIIDGKSKDKTLHIVNKLIEEYKNGTISFQIVSEKDNGIYDAMNKGIKIASGKWILFLNAGDYFFNHEIISDIFSQDYDDNITGIYGDTLRYSGEYQKRVNGKSLNYIEKEIPLPFCHQSIFVSSNLMKDNLFNTCYKYAADYDFFVKCFLLGCHFEYIPKVISCYSMGGASEINTIKHLAEKIQIRERNNLERYSPMKKKYMIWNLVVRQRIKQFLPDSLINTIRGFQK